MMTETTITRKRTAGERPWYYEGHPSDGDPCETCGGEGWIDCPDQPGYVEECPTCTPEPDPPAPGAPAVQLVVLPAPAQAYRVVITGPLGRSQEQICNTWEDAVFCKCWMEVAGSVAEIVPINAPALAAA